MTLAELDTLIDDAEKDFQLSFKSASEKLNKTNKYDEAQIQALAKSDATLAKLIEGYRTNLVADAKIKDKKYSVDEL